ncbi:MAG: hypothetical protein IT580_11565 [Verrucomicrobiales bacterium]|nr:hypothetical protein [Verrucomicrobiales bacterium]
MDDNPHPGRLLKSRRDRVLVSVVINQLATPGLGSWIAGRRLAGMGQLALSIAGFLEFMAYFGLLIWQSIRALTQGVETPGPSATLWRTGLLLFGLAWLWSGLTSWQLWRECQAQDLRERSECPPGPLPPRLS